MKTRPRSKLITHDSTQSTRRPTTSYSNSGAYTHAGVDDVDFTGGSVYTGTSTGDSGFGDAAFQRRIPLKPNAPTHSQLSATAAYYKSLNKETVEGEVI